MEHPSSIPRFPPNPICRDKPPRSELLPTTSRHHNRRERIRSGDNKKPPLLWETKEVAISPQMEGVPRERQHLGTRDSSTRPSISQTIPRKAPLDGYKNPPRRTKNRSSLSTLDSPVDSSSTATNNHPVLPFFSFDGRRPAPDPQARAFFKALLRYPPFSTHQFEEFRPCQRSHASHSHTVSASFACTERYCRFHDKY
jgi:hypothetical protein